MKKRLILWLIVFALILSGAFLYFKGKRYEVIISQAQIDSTLAKTFPATKKVAFIFSITFANPEVLLLEAEDRIRVGMEATLNIRLNEEARNLGGRCTLTSGIRYDSQTQEFFLDDASFDRLEIQGIPDEYLEHVTKVASEAAKEFVGSKPVYTLEAKDGKTAAAKLLLKDFEVKEQSVFVTLGI